MAKKKLETQPESITIRYDLHELPTAQHKAGLAGLLLQIESMSERRAVGALPRECQVPEVVEHAVSFARIRFTKRSVQDLFDDLYAAQTDGKRVRPVLSFLRPFMDDGKESWHRLHSDVLQYILRVQPQSWNVWKRRAKGEAYEESDFDPWRAVLSASDSRPSTVSVVAVKGTTFIGSQAVNAEKIRFCDLPHHALLLHFWPLVSRIFVPEEIAQNKITKQWEYTFRGYVVAVPEVSDISTFCDAYKIALSELSPKTRRKRPADSIVSLPAQGSLEFLRQLSELAERRVLKERPSRYVASVDYFYMLRSGQNCKILTHGRVPHLGKLLERYTGIRSNYHNPLFQCCYLLAALQEKPWFADFDAPLAEREWSFFVHSTQDKHNTPLAMTMFASEVERRFQLIGDNHKTLEESRMLDLTTIPDAVDRLVYELVGKYVREQASAKAQAKGKISKDDPQWWTKAAEELRDVSSKLFLELRSRNGDDFVRHFTTTLGSVPQWLDNDRYLVVAAALMRIHAEGTGENRFRTRDDVKILTLLALSGHSRSLKTTRGADESSIPEPEKEEKEE